MKYLPVCRFGTGPGMGLGRRVERILRGLGDYGLAGGEARGREGAG